MSNDEETWKPKKMQYCFVTSCKSNSIKDPTKTFFKVPVWNREAWSKAAGRLDVPSSSVDICEDHFDLQEDVENYLKWTLVKARPKLKSKVPAKLIALKLFSSECTRTLEPDAVPLTAQPECTFKEDQAVLCVPDLKNASVQASVKMVNTAVNTMLTRTNVFLPPIIEDISEDETLPSTQGSTIEISEFDAYTDSTSITNVSVPVNKHYNIISLVEKKPSKYIGLPKKFQWLIDFISKNTNVPTLHIIVVLYKLKQGDPFYKISDLFNISETTLWRIFWRTLDILPTILAQFIYWPSSEVIKKNLPLSFRIKKEYANTQSIIDCFEVEIEKPSNPIQQASTWSQYKNCNTVKFLISATPDGFINFISKGYGGRISDIKLVEESGFLNCVKPNSTILADRGFKHLEPVLQKKSVQLLRPPSVFTNKKMTKSEAIEAKVIASLRIHIERVIRRVRLFKILKPHSTINNKIVNCVDDAVIVACGLINLQSPIIKTK